MKLSDKQYLFAQDLILLMTYLVVNKIKFTEGESYRTDYQQEEYIRNGFSRVKRSKHQDRLAKDFNLWLGNKSMWSMSPEEQKKAFQHVGDFWEGLRVGNKWGGNFSSWIDATHFEGSF